MSRISKTEKVIKELSEGYSCDSIQDITYEKIGKRYIVYLHAWNGTIFKLTITKAEIDTSKRERWKRNEDYS